MSRAQAEIKARNWTLLASKRHPSLNYRAEPAGGEKSKEWSVIQYLGDHPVGIAMT